MSRFVHQRHRPSSALQHPRELVLACPPLRSNVNLSRIVRTAGCCGLQRLIVCGNPRIDPKIARDSLEQVEIEVRRSLVPVLKRFKAERYQIVGLEQTSNSVSLYDFEFSRRTVLVVGNEREGLSEAILNVLDHVVEIPVFGQPNSYNVASATAMALYEYCRQYPEG